MRLHMDSVAEDYSAGEVVESCRCGCAALVALQACRDGGYVYTALAMYDTSDKWNGVFYATISAYFAARRW